VNDEKKLPSMWKMARNATKAAFRAAAAVIVGDEIRVDETEFEDRLGICREPCELYIIEGEEERCAHEDCGCYLAIKAGLATETCPLNKWPGDAIKIMLNGG
jgi:hypothetical protein